MKIERQQFESLALEHLDMPYRVARWMTRDSHRAEDLVQEIFLRAFLSADERREKSSCRPKALSIRFSPATPGAIRPELRMKGGRALAFLV